MEIFKPDIYKKSIFDIPYNQLKEKGILCLVFDLDNTLGLVSDKKCPEKTKKLLQELKKDFIIVISSNNNNKRLSPYIDDLEIDGVCWSMKPSTKALRKICKKYKLKKNEICMIGDQLVTDILAGNRFHAKTVLVDPLGKKDLKITSLNRKIETLILKNYQKKGLLERGKYYGE